MAEYAITNDKRKEIELIATVYFERKSQYKKFLTVFKRSAYKQMPETRLKIIRPKEQENINHKWDCGLAFIAAAEYVLKSKQPIAMCDVDLMFLKPINDIWKKPFDIAVTVRNYRMKYNTGLWFYRPTRNAKKFMQRWLDNTRLIMNNYNEYLNVCQQNGGIDQASLYLTIRENISAHVLELPCLEWNACQTEWDKITAETRIIHVKSKLRLACIGRFEPTEEYNYLIPLVKIWKEYLRGKNAKRL